MPMELFGFLRQVLGHQNDAMQCVAIPNIGVDLPFPNDCFFIGGNGYPKRYPVVTSFFRHQITNADERDRKK